MRGTRGNEAGARRAQTLRGEQLLAQHVLVHQPVVDLRDGATRAVETLAPWAYAASHVPEARLAAWLLDRVAAQHLGWYVDGLTVDVCVDLPVHLLGDAATVRAVHCASQELAALRCRLVLDLAESGAWDGDVARAARALHDAGVGLALDDVGGAPSVQAVHAVPLDSTKLSARVVKALPGSTQVREAVTRVVAQAHDRGSSVVAQGVESDAQLQAARSVGVDLAQGSLLARHEAGWRVPAAVVRASRTLVALRLQTSSPPGTSPG